MLKGLKINPLYTYSVYIVQLTTSKENLRQLFGYLNFDSSKEFKQWAGVINLILKQYAMLRYISLLS